MTIVGFSFDSGQVVSKRGSVRAMGRWWLSERQKRP